MIERIIFRIRRVFSRHRFGYLFTALAEQIDESSRRIAWNLEAAQDLAVLGQNLLAVEPGEDFGIITPGQHELQVGYLVSAVAGGMPAPRESRQKCQRPRARAGGGAPLLFPRAPFLAVFGNFLLNLFVAHALQRIRDSR